MFLDFCWFLTFLSVSWRSTALAAKRINMRKCRKEKNAKDKCNYCKKDNNYDDDNDDYYVLLSKATVAFFNPHVTGRIWIYYSVSITNVNILEFDNITWSMTKLDVSWAIWCLIHDSTEISFIICAEETIIISRTFNLNMPIRFTIIENHSRCLLSEIKVDCCIAFTAIAQ